MPFYQFLGEGSPPKIDETKTKKGDNNTSGTLILTSPLKKTGGPRNPPLAVLVLFLLLLLSRAATPRGAPPRAGPVRLQAGGLGQGHPGQARPRLPESYGKARSAVSVSSPIERGKRGEGPG